MHERYERTAMTPLRAARNTGYIDWGMQPSPFKHYPDGLFSYDVGAHDALRCVALARRVTAHRSVGGRPYLQLNTPSAGNLHPVELYVQVRGVQGVVSGIYHVDAARDKLVLVREVESDGLEHTLGLERRFNGMIFVVSVVPFRSYWKYGERSWRYCCLDAGHQVGALQAAAAATERDATILSGFDAHCLDAVMGFSAEERSVAVVLSGEAARGACAPVAKPLMRVSPTDYCDMDDAMLEDFVFPYAGVTVPFPPGLMPSHLLENAIETRRSARGFDGTPLESEALERLMQLVSRSPQPLVCHSVMLRGETHENGLYEGARLVQAGDFADEITALSAGQNFVSASSLVLIVSAPRFGAGALMSAAAFAHALHLYAASRRLGFSGIGAFYDRRLQRFLGTDTYILYVMAIGNERAAA